MAYMRDRGPVDCSPQVITFLELLWAHLRCYLTIRSSIASQLQAPVSSSCCSEFQEELSASLPKTSAQCLHQASCVP